MNKLMLGLLIYSTVGLSSLPAIADNTAPSLQPRRHLLLEDSRYCGEISRPSHHNESCVNWLYPNQPQLPIPYYPGTNNNDNEECNSNQFITPYFDTPVLIDKVPQSNVFIAHNLQDE